MVHSFLKISKELFVFTKKPVDEPKSNNSFAQNFKTLILLLIISFVLVFFATILFLVINTYLFDFLSQGKFDEVFANISLTSILFLVSIIAPVVEEIIFRLALRYKHNYIFRGVDFIFKTKKVSFFWTKNYRLFYYTSIIAFGLIHLTNYHINSYWFLIFAPFIILPQLIIGVILSFIRMKSGFIWAILLHSLYNGILTLGMILFFNKSIITDYTSDSYKLKIEQLTYGLDKETYSSSKEKNDSIYYFDIRNNSLRNVLYQLKEDTRNYKNLNTRLNILLEKDTSKIHKKVIIKELQKHFSIDKKFVQ
ncbi:CPBP family intramembrane glutamic endopeptidase [uncultured Aquimarina sp.]|uniref:CPBP family intramembrane glutamic endopeptidase n=1 Tax=uncultured Aquimarina sp. TaxID=575652 RepID=UPI00262AA4B0|nr:CPBP family intramembrane glutamic endopeptidase [uncultured Aquimarina sp.]